MNGRSTTGEDVCCACGQPLDATNVASCNACGRRFHLITRSDTAGRDCGSVWINERFQALEFGCDCCLGRDTSTSAPGGARYVRHSGSARAILARRAKRRRKSPRPASAPKAEARPRSNVGKHRRGR